MEQFNMKKINFLISFRNITLVSTALGYVISQHI